MDRYLKHFEEPVSVTKLIGDLGTQQARLVVRGYLEKDWIRRVEMKRGVTDPHFQLTLVGRAAWDRYEEVHTHTFFIFESDPITGMPMLLAGNSGKPRIVTWDSEMIRAPKRSIRHRIRLNTEWLYDHIVIKHPAEGERWAASLTVAEDRE